MKIGVGASISAAAAGRIGVSSTYAKVQIPMTEAESRRVPKPRGIVLTTGIVILGVIIFFSAMIVGIALTSSLPEERSALVPGAAWLLASVGLLTACGRWRYNRNKWTRTRFDFKTDELILYAHPAFAAAVAEANDAAAVANPS
ncbi:hypothetical protein KSP35_17045 [Aquihabitans sp. G128]|uniref:hypothetical protein n=1 Tax=Aquihabitans sp. G128 TaxID=2849779 RepID=UPI001C221B31|nr:hypothetical protein [Aquihabitans sp. G128]QXC60056.1 hypothetical protein KSP35_17045 [Aquihabitans sp. G128]